MILYHYQFTLETNHCGRVTCGRGQLDFWQFSKVTYTWNAMFIEGYIF